MPKEDRSKLDKEILLRAYETARAWSGLIVTLATGAIVFTAIFRRDIAAKDQPLEHPGLLLATWIALGLAAILGIIYLGSLTAILNKGKHEELDVYGCTSRIIATKQILSFFVGVIMLLVFLGFNLL